ncbi:MAG: helix-turn-helix domain-containing protein, partial [Chloroflexi bacterium]|nr:helix-turn-helix domain-containing protein [Chloroflexota bacterium]
YRLAAGLSQRELAERSGITRQAVNAIEQGRYVPGTSIALRLAQILGCRVEDLFVLEPDVEVVESAFIPPAQPVGGPWRAQVATVEGRLVAAPLEGRLATIATAQALVEEGPQTLARLRPGEADPERMLFVAGCDPALGLLAAHVARRNSSFCVCWLERSSSVALRLLGERLVHIAGSHLTDPETGAADLDAIRRLVPGLSLVVITLSEWREGLIVARGNPLGIRGAVDLVHPGLGVVVREEGSGSRLFLERMLRAAEVSSVALLRPLRVLASHWAVGQAVADGWADVGPGVEVVARALGLGFVPLQQVRFDLVIPRHVMEDVRMGVLLDVVASGPFRQELEALGGYDTRMAGRLVTEW